MTNLAVALIGALSLINLMLTFAVIRQLRRHGELPSHGPGLDTHRPPWHLPPGTPAPEFTAETVTGETISLSDLTGSRSVVAFLAMNCAPCREQLPQLREYASSIPGGAAQVLAVVIGDREKADRYMRELSGVATVVVEPIHGPVVQAFSVGGYPTIYALDERGQIQASGGAVRQIIAASPA
jgi:peroxiredoxin